MAHWQSTREARRSVEVIGLGQVGWGIAANLDRAGLWRAAFDIEPEACGRAGPAADIAGLPPSGTGNACDREDFARLYPRIDELLEAEARKRSSS